MPVCIFLYRRHAYHMEEFTRMNIQSKNYITVQVTPDPKREKKPGIVKYRRRLVCALLLCAALGCTACGKNTTGSGTAEDALPDESGQPDDDSTAGTADLSVENTTENTEADGSAAGNDTYVNSVTSGIDIQMRTEEDNKTTENGTVYYSRWAEYPVVTMEGNPEAAGKINADIRARVDACKANTETETWAEELLQDMEDPDFIPLGYSDGLTFQTVRADSSVISFRLLYETYSGGAHGNQTARGANYNARTGELIAFSDLSDDPVAFREDTLAYNQQLAQTESYAMRMFSADDVTNGSLESVLYADDAWYLSTTGLVFMSDPYALGPYAAGLIEFIIPYADLADMGLKESYAGTDRFVLKMQPRSTYTADLNGDGDDDTVLIYSETAEKEDGTAETIPCLIINDTDFAKEGAAGIQEQLRHFPDWAETALYDLQPEDAYIELVYVSYESGPTEEDYGYYSYFYRYTEDRTLVYLGKVKGDINDPTVRVDGLM